MNLSTTWTLQIGGKMGLESNFRLLGAKLEDIATYFVHTIYTQIWGRLIGQKWYIKIKYNLNQTGFLFG